MSKSDLHRRGDPAHRHRKDSTPQCGGRGRQDSRIENRLACNDAIFDPRSSSFVHGFNFIQGKIAMKLAVVGAGAIGAFVGAMLAKSGADVTLIARGAHLRAMQERGMRVRGSLGEFEARPVVTDDPASIGAVDVALLTLKAHSLIEMAPRLSPLLGPETCVVSAQNGIPWWYFYRHGGDWEGTRLETVDPGGVISRHLDPARVVGCVVYPSTEIVEPGVVLHTEGTRFAIGEPDGSKSERCRRIAEVFINAGLRCPVRTNLRHD